MYEGLEGLEGDVFDGEGEGCLEWDVGMSCSWRWRAEMGDGG